MSLLFHAPACQENAHRNLFLKHVLFLSIIIGAVIVLLAVRVARADNLELDPDQIKAMLHTTSDIEGGFVDRVVGMVKAGTLPRDLFTSCLIWARKKPRHQFQYFKQALTVRAAEIGINLDVQKTS
jgi:hypothetical protein